MTPGYWHQASADLALLDPVLATLVGRFAGTALVSRGDPFVTLLRSIVGQQISVQAADSVWARFLAAMPPVVAPAAVLAIEAATLRRCGLSARKVEYVVDLARHFDGGQIHPDRWTTMSDAEITAELTTVRGIGVWTAEMFLIFNQLRPDVFPLDDLGLQKAVAIHYCAGERPGRRLLAEYGERWRPWRSVATWYLWRSLDPLPVEY
ncbi:MAG TPA: DNA-3-methyladenine glycosylase [Accumulibacter sp.]|uniref:DNA-3-methyladenine glycosylase II n=1 Tax=Candidatus Accumulibacter cognatus TaxID=2954383 RepID=A0A7D5SDL9_9PROT|nr:DNA-3-methyladenine glycosylase [Accumulibacter sp.]QLH49564.1 MAG: DNA-3-methyladenine glycosylase 2 family protein [Candidatus Accumulibacter cognatus]MBL8401421.1 DNA-3-methyladenine glycosylase 2 family protein [Accumulibacter sp.]MCM8580156.1 DNA-3-methyladenine glycosylase [Accumulibacter sp.]HMW57214.1 DNA-3-methyladenine glycosylase [Accumulibacter sp.]HNC22315.1 DNA-3-methyladenine glycosylase [Accumulibacter sp.]